MYADTARALFHPCTVQASQLSVSPSKDLLSPITLHIHRRQDCSISRAPVRSVRRMQCTGRSYLRHATLSDSTQSFQPSMLAALCRNAPGLLISTRRVDILTSTFEEMALTLHVFRDRSASRSFRNGRTLSMLRSFRNKFIFSALR